MKQLFSGRTEEDAVVCVSYVIKARLWTNPYLLDSAKKECQISSRGKRRQAAAALFMTFAEKCKKKEFE